MNRESNRQRQEASSSAEGTQEPRPGAGWSWANLSGNMLRLIYDRLYPSHHIHSAEARQDPQPAAERSCTTLSGDVLRKIYDRLYPSHHIHSAEVRQPPQPADQRSWANLSVDVLRLIYIRLYPSHHIHFAGVCRPWRQYSDSLPTRTFPLLMPGLQQSSSCLLRSPFHDHIYVEYHLPEARRTPCRGSIDGWLLYGALSEGERPFFFDPTLSNPRVFLPPWRWRQWRPRWDAIISSAPTDTTGCTVVFLADKMILHCRATDERWSSCEAGTNLDNCTGVFFGGTLHVIHGNGRLGVVNFSNSQNPVRWLSMDVLPQHQFQELAYGRQFLLESAGTLLLVYVTFLGYWNVLRADLMTGTWKPVEDLGDQSLFLAPGGSVSAVAVEADVEANRLYLAHGLTQQAMPADTWMSVATHSVENSWYEISKFRYFDRTEASLLTSRWVFQRVDVHEQPPRERLSWDSFLAFYRSESRRIAWFGSL